MCVMELTSQKLQSDDQRPKNVYIYKFIFQVTLKINHKKNIKKLEFKKNKVNKSSNKY